VFDGVLVLYANDIDRNVGGLLSKLARL
jgi:hypothetical protein